MAVVESQWTVSPGGHKFEQFCNCRWREWSYCDEWMTRFASQRHQNLWIKTLEESCWRMISHLGVRCSCQFKSFKFDTRQVCQSLLSSPKSWSSRRQWVGKCESLLLCLFESRFVNVCQILSKSWAWDKNIGPISTKQAVRHLCFWTAPFFFCKEHSVRFSHVLKSCNFDVVGSRIFFLVILFQKRRSILTATVRIQLPRQIPLSQLKQFF